jgi:hypothetical protein
MNATKVVNIGGLPEVGNNNNSAQKDPMRQAVAHQQNCVRPGGKIQMGSTLNSGFSPDGKRAIQQTLTKKQGEKNSQGELENTNGGFLPVFHQRKT